MPISVLSNISKIYERSFYDQIYSYFDKIFALYQCNFCEDISTQDILITMIEKKKISHENKQCCKLFSQTSQKHLTRYLTTYLLLS